MKNNATGPSTRQAVLMNPAATRKPTPLRTHSIQALNRLISPDGRWRSAVRGFFASNWRSTIRLNAIAHVRAQIRQMTISINSLTPGKPYSTTAGSAALAFSLW